MLNLHYLIFSHNVTGSTLKYDEYSHSAKEEIEAGIDEATGHQGHAAGWRPSLR